MSRRPHPSDEGFSLVESLVAVTMLGVAILVIVAALETSARGTAIQGTQAGADLVLRNAAEHVRGVAYEACPVEATYDVASVGTPAGMTVEVTEVEHWDGDGFVDDCPLADGGFQRVTLVATGHAGTVVRTLEIVKRRP